MLSPNMSSEKFSDLRNIFKIDEVSPVVAGVAVDAADDPWRTPDLVWQTELNN